MLTQLYLAIPLAEVIGRVFGARGPAAAATLGATYSLAYGLGFLIFGPLSDRYGRKPILVPGMVAPALATAGLAAASSLPMVAVLRTGQGLVAASFSRGGTGVCGRGASATLATQPGSAPCPPLSWSPALSARCTPQAIAETLGWRWAFGLAAPALAIGAVAMAIVLLEPAPERPAGQLGWEISRTWRIGGPAGARIAVRRQYSCAVQLCRDVCRLRSAAAKPIRAGPWQRVVCAFGRATGLATCSVGGLALWDGTAPSASPSPVICSPRSALPRRPSPVAALWALVLSSVIFVLGIATIVPALIALIGGREAPPERELSPSRAWRCSPEPRLVHWLPSSPSAFRP